MYSKQTSVVQRQQHPLVQAGPVEVPGDGLAGPAVQLQLLRVGRVRVRLCQDVAVAVLVEGVLQGVAMRGETLSREQGITAGSWGDGGAEGGKNEEKADEAISPFLVLVSNQMCSIVDIE